MQTIAASALEEALAAAHQTYTQANPKSLAYHQEAHAALPGGNTRTILYFSPFPLRFVQGEGCKLYDLDGHQYYDFLGEYSAGIYGHSHPVILQTIKDALATGLNLGGHNLLEPQFAQAVCERFKLDRVRFTNSGTEANLMALVTARAVTGRSKIMVFEGGYHGGVLYFPKGGSPVNAPFDTVMAPYNDVEVTRVLLRQHGRELAAVLVEPMLGSGGSIAGTPEFLQMLRQETQRAESVLIFDEVITSRLAPHGLGHLLGIQADLTTLGKYIGGGMSFGAFGGRAEIMNRYDPSRPDALPHAGTFNNNTLTMSVGFKAITEVYTPEAAKQLSQRGDALRGKLNALAHQYQAPLQFTGLGSVMTAHFTREALSTSADLGKGHNGLKELFFFDLLAQGVYLARRGMIILSLPSDDLACDRLIAAVETFLQQRQELLRATVIR